MKKKIIVLALCSLSVLASCGNDDKSSVSSSESSSLSDNERVSNLLSNIKVGQITSFDFIDRSYDFDSYYNAKYFITGNAKKAYVNYKATHNFSIYKDLISDEIDVDGLEGVETPVSKTNISAKGQIYTDMNNYLYDFLVCEEEPSQSYVNCYEMDYFTNLKTYFDYLDIIGYASKAFSSPETYFSEDNGYETYSFNFSSKDEIYTFTLEGRYSGDSTYSPYIINFEVNYNNKTSSFDKITYKERSLLNGIDGDFETETSSLRIWEISNIKIGEKTTYSGKKYTFDDITNKSQIHDAPIEKADLSNTSDGKISDEITLQIFKNIYAYSNDINQMNYSMYYHDAFDIADTSKDIGDAVFSGKIISYSNNITDNVGTIQKVDKNGLPLSEDPANFRIFTEVVDTSNAKGILRTAEFDKYMTSSLAFESKSNFASSRAYLDPNPLYWSEISNIYSAFEKYGLGEKMLSTTSSIKITVSGEKKGNSLSLSSQIHTTTNLTEYIDRFSFEIKNDKLEYMKFETSGKNYTDIYEGRFLHNEKKEFVGERIDDEEITNQISMDQFNII